VLAALKAANASRTADGVVAVVKAGDMKSFKKPRSNSTREATLAAATQFAEEMAFLKLRSAATNHSRAGAAPFADELAAAILAVLAAFTSEVGLDKRKIDGAVMARLETAAARLAPEPAAAAAAPAAADDGTHSGGDTQEAPMDTESPPSSSQSGTAGDNMDVDNATTVSESDDDTDDAATAAAPAAVAAAAAHAAAAAAAEARAAAAAAAVPAEAPAANAHGDGGEPAPAPAPAPAARSRVSMDVDGEAAAGNDDAAAAAAGAPAPASPATVVGGGGSHPLPPPLPFDAGADGGSEEAAARLALPRAARSARPRPVAAVHICRTCNERIEDGAKSVTFGDIYYHEDCAPGALFLF
jgi:hypothetical protein